MTTKLQPYMENTSKKNTDFQEEWFSVKGDVDDFIFFGQNSKVESDR